MHIPDLYDDVPLQMLKQRVKALEVKLAKPWVGLTDKEMELLVIQAREVPVEIPCDSFTTRLLKLAEAKLKEKNGAT